MEKENEQSNGCESSQPTLLSVFDSDLQQLGLRVGIDRAKNTYIRQCQLRRCVADFMAECLHTNDILLMQLTPSFIRDFAIWLSSGRHYLGGTVWLACQQLKSVVSRAYQHGMMPNNPFYDFRIGRNIRPRQFLTEQELQQFINWSPANPQQVYYRDLFVFSALTGVAFADIMGLHKENICVIDGRQWIIGRRRKTQIPFQVRLLPRAVDIINSYATNSEKLFPPVCYRTLAKHIPLMLKSCGICKYITFHCARHTFAVMSLNAGMPIESISRILGHADITTTQIYAKITLAKLNTDMDSLDSHMQHLLTTTSK